MSNTSSMSNQNARATADSLGLYEMDLTARKVDVSLKTRGGMTIVLGANGILNIDLADKNKTSVHFELLTPDYGIQCAVLQKGVERLTLTDSSDLNLMAHAARAMHTGQVSTIYEGLDRALRQQQGSGRAPLPGDWFVAKQVEAYNAMKLQPLRYETPAHLKNPKPEDVLDYHLQGFKKEKNGTSGELTYSYQSTHSEKLVLKAGKDGVITSLTFNGRSLLPTMEAGSVLIVAASDCKSKTRGTSSRGNPSIADEAEYALNNALRSYYEPRDRSFMGWLETQEKLYAEQKPVVPSNPQGFKPLSL